MGHYVVRTDLRDCGQSDYDEPNISRYLQFVHELNLSRILPNIVALFKGIFSG